jgi:hypothetical protein
MLWTVLDLFLRFPHILSQPFLNSSFGIKVKSWNDRWSAGQSALVSGTHYHISITVSCKFADMGHSLWQKEGSVVYNFYNCCSALPVKSYLVWVHMTQSHILLSQMWDSPNLQDQVPIFISPRNSVAQLDTHPLPQHWVSPNPLTNSLSLWSSPRGLQWHSLEAVQSAVQLPTFLILLHDITIGAHPYVLGQKWRNSQ